MNKASDEIINKTYALYKQSELNKKGEKAGNALGKRVVSLYSTEISWAIKIRDVKKLHQDIENDPIIKDQMSNLGCLLVRTFGNFLAPVLVAAHTVNNLDLGNEQGYENEGYKRIKKLFLKRTTNKISSVKLFSFNAVELCIMIINERPGVCTREVCKALEYDAKASKTET